MLTEGGIPIPEWSLLAPDSAPGGGQVPAPWCPCRAGLQCQLWLTPVLLSSAWRLPAGLREGLHRLTGGLCWVPTELRHLLSLRACMRACAC